ncbi:acyl carrier protein [Nostocaceae cyanobacterium CENA357]|uniref:Acyl carrier protein n=1 Tax=Atlanticothrix silvestris CENA357 TaxID=1725252 RepID=A0A8J7HBN0_9CYAN|nr:acyl carrier protein [Atlanticothrix silvestris]MBH8552328.1 acyl carrier protein [Atlanticothrix silvestris CENA357]
MKDLQTVTNNFTNTGLFQFLASSQNPLVEWIQNFSNSTETVLCQSNSETQYSQKQFQTEKIIEGWLVFYLSKLLLVNHSEINIHLPFEYYGITSLEALRLTYAIEVWLGRKFSLELVYEYPTVKVLAQHLAQEIECVCVS